MRERCICAYERIHADQFGFTTKPVEEWVEESVHRVTHAYHKATRRLFAFLLVLPLIFFLFNGVPEFSGRLLHWQDSMLAIAEFTQDKGLAVQAGLLDGLEQDTVRLSGLTDGLSEGLETSCLRVEAAGEKAGGNMAAAACAAVNLQPRLLPRLQLARAAGGSGAGEAAVWDELVSTVMLRGTGGREHRTQLRDEITRLMQQCFDTFTDRVPELPNRIKSKFLLLTDKS